jgi:D-3-phosphoglycerate dehydrogenase
MKILLASKIDPATIERLSESHDVSSCFDGTEEELIAAIPGTEAIIFRSGVQISGPVMSASPELRLLIRAGSGMDNIDLDYVNDNDLALERIPQPGAKAVSELSFAFMLALARDLLNTDRLTREGAWPKHQVKGRLLTGKTLGVVGYGNIGSRVGRMGAAWGMSVLGTRRPDYPFPEIDVSDHHVEFTDLDDLLARSDFVAIHCPLDDTTRNLIGARELSLMKPGSILVNLARGGVVDEEALLKELEDGSRLIGAATDVHANEGPGKISPLADLDNVILTPHMGAMAIEVQSEIGARILELVEQYDKQAASGPEETQ